MKKTIITYKTIYSYCGGYLGNSICFKTRKEQIKFENEYKQMNDSNKSFISSIVITEKGVFSKPKITVEEIAEWWED